MYTTVYQLSIIPEIIFHSSVKKKMYSELHPPVKTFLENLLGMKKCSDMELMNTENIRTNFIISHLNVSPI